MDGAKGRIPKSDPVFLMNSPTKQWNTKDLGHRVIADFSSAGSAALLVSPVICVIDRSIVENASTGKEIGFRACFLRSLRPLYSTPHRFLFSKPFGLIFALYFATYSTANVFDTISSTVHSKPPATVSGGPSKFIATTAVNMPLCVFKDSHFAKWFNHSNSAASKVPATSFALFALRDSMTIFASFNLPPLLAPRLAELRAPLADYFNTEKKRLNVVQFLAPATMQLLSTPIHLLGLDMYNRQGRLGFMQRFARVRRDWLISSFARMGRIVPAFGIGGVVNADCRRKLMPA